MGVGSRNGGSRSGSRRSGSRSSRSSGNRSNIGVGVVRPLSSPSCTEAKPRLLSDASPHEPSSPGGTALFFLTSEKECHRPLSAPRS